MGYLFVMLGVMSITAIVTVVAIVFNYHRRPIYRKTIAVGLVLSVLMAAFAFVYGGIISDSVNNLTDTYEDLTLYQSTIENSTNEYVRYDYYNKVNAYNEEFESHQIAALGKWLGAFYPRNWDTEIGLIDFVLHGDNYAG